MPVIGTFSAAGDGYAGTIRTLMLTGRVRIAPNAGKSAVEAPDYRVLMGDIEIGAAWRKTKQGTERPYLKVRLDDPAWPLPVWGVLMESTADGVLRLVWRRASRSE